MPSHPFTAALEDHLLTLTALLDVSSQVVGLPARTLARLAGAPVVGPAEVSTGVQAHLAALQRELEEARAELEQLRASRAGAPAAEALADQKRQVLAWLEPWLLQLPLVRAAVAAGAPTTAADVLALFDPVEATLQGWGYEPLGEVGSQLPFDPSVHQPVGFSPATGDPVRVRQPGYRLDGCLVRRARVVPS